MRNVANVAILAFGFLLLIVQATLATHVSLHPFTPNLMLPMVIFLGVQPEVGMLRGALISFLLGYLLDEFCGSPMGLQTFVLVATFMVARGAGIRLFLRGALFQIGLVFVAGIIAGGTILALRAIFSPADPFPLEMPATGLAGDVVALLTSTGEDDAPLVGSILGTALTLIGSAAATAIFAPGVFSVMRRLDALETRRREAGEGAPTE
jgi:rod shape-determining protein MreD